MRGQHIIDRCRSLAELSEEPGRITRTFLSPPVREVHRMIGAWMQDAGMAVRVDDIGNLVGSYEAEHPGASTLLIGSHIDTVPDAGAFDGVLGVMIGLALVEALK